MSHLMPSRTLAYTISQKRRARRVAQRMKINQLAEFIDEPTAACHQVLSESLWLRNSIPKHFAVGRAFTLLQQF